MQQAKPKTPSMREVRREARRGEFLEVARSLFLSRGYDETTIESVSTGAGYSKRTVYLYFETKHELFCAVLHPELVALCERLQRSVPLAGDARSRLIAMAREYVDFTRDRPEVFALMMRFETHDFYRGRDRGGLPRYAAGCLALNEQLSGRVDELIKLGLADGSIRSETTPAQLNLMFWATLVGLLQVCRQRDAILESHYRISGPRLVNAFIERFLPDPRGMRSPS